MADLLAQLQTSLSNAATVERELGGGGMSRVFVAEERELRRKVVVKVLPPAAASGIDAERFQREIEVAATLQHPLIVPLLWAERDGELLYYAMPYVEGESLRARLGRERELPVLEALGILRDVAGALSYAHGRGVVHRDVKPDNVLLSGGYAMVTDFGVARALASATGSARLTATGISLGTPAYMAPEQVAADGSLDHRADIYALGAMAYEMLAGRAPFVGGSVQAVLAAQMTQTPPPIRTQRATVPPSIDALVARCLAKSPADRWQSAGELRAALDAEILALSSGEQRRLAAPRRRRALAIAGAVLAVAAIALAGRAFVRRGALGGSGDVTRSVAVMPFVNASPDRDNEYFSDGVAEELLVALAKATPLRVASRSSSFAFKGKDAAARDVGRQLGVDAVIEGSVRKAGERLRITAQLTRVTDGVVLWSDSYDRDARDVFAVQEELARSIVGAVAPRLASGGSVRPAGAAASLVAHGTSDPEAYDLYLRGRYFFNRRTHDGFRRAAEYFAQAIGRDSGYARAWAGLADSYCIQSNFGARSSSEVCPRSIEAAQRAIALDSTLAEAWASLGFVALFHEWNVPKARRLFRHAIELDSTYATAHLWLMQTEAAANDTAAGLQAIRRAVALEPLSLIMNSRLGTMLRRAGRDRESLAQLQRTAEMDPSYPDVHSQLAETYMAMRQPERAVAELQRIDDTTGIALAYAQAGRAAEARRLLTLAERDTGYVPALPFAYAYAALGDMNTAMRWFERAYTQREPDVVFLSAEALDAPEWWTVAARDPRFAALEARIRAHWREE